MWICVCECIFCGLLLLGKKFLWKIIIDYIVIFGFVGVVVIKILNVLELSF